MGEKYGFIDKAWHAVGGRKFLAWCIATWLFYISKVDMETWKWITAVFIGANLAEKGIKTVGDAITVAVEKINEYRIRRETIANAKTNKESGDHMG